MLPLRAAATAVRAGLPLSPVTVAHLAADATAARPVAGTPPGTPWSSCSAGGPALVAVWESLDLAGLTAAWIPEWAGVRNRPQRNAIHRHTVDRHLVETVVTLASRPARRRPAGPAADGGAAARHRQAAGRHGPLPVGAPLACRAAQRMGLSSADAAVVERLVREHLTLVELATRRDPDDPRTVAGPGRRGRRPGRGARPAAGADRGGRAWPPARWPGRRGGPGWSTTWSTGPAPRCAARRRRARPRSPHRGRAGAGGGRRRPAAGRGVRAGRHARGDRGGHRPAGLFADIAGTLAVSGWR